MNNLSGALRCLAVRPASTGGQHGGDEVVYRRSLPYLAARYDLDVLELHPVSKATQILKLATGTPPEATRFLSAANGQALAARLAAARYDVVVFFNEVTFPFLPVAKRSGLPAVLVAQNVHSLVAATDPSALARALRPLAVAFERRYYADPAAGLVCISRADIAGLAAAGVRRDDVYLAPAGAPPAAPLAPDAPVLAEAVITGSYGWWRKRRDLRVFAEGPSLGVPIRANDPVALEILGDQGLPLDETDPAWSWSAGLRVGLITDAFVGGFKLKSVEYVAKNCVAICLSDISAEFDGLPHAGEFVRIVRDKAQARDAVAALRAQDSAALVGRFLEFKQACLARYAWDACLAPLGEAVAARIARAAESAGSSAASSPGARIG